MSKRPDASVRVRCYQCGKVFVVNLVMEEDAPSGDRAEMRHPCPYCGKDNMFDAPKSAARAEPMYREVTFCKAITGRKAE